MNVSAIVPATPANSGPSFPVENSNPTDSGLLDFASLLQSHIDAGPATPNTGARASRPGSPREPQSGDDLLNPDLLGTGLRPHALPHQPDEPKHDLVAHNGDDTHNGDDDQNTDGLPRETLNSDGLLAEARPDISLDATQPQPIVAEPKDDRLSRASGKRDADRLTGPSLRAGGKSLSGNFDAAHKPSVPSPTPTNAEATSLSTPPAQNNHSAGLWSPAGDVAAAPESAAGSPSGAEALLNPAPQVAQPRIATTAATAAATAQASIDTPTHDPDFSNALAARVSLLAKDGVQKATLRLHPAEMGPVQVQIVIEGGRAMVSFSAAQGATCELLQSSMSELASAMGEAGLDFGGGDVSQQAQSDETAPTRLATDNTSASDRQDQTEPTASKQRPRGMLDLFA